MANLPEPDWFTLFESAEQAERAFGGERSAVEAALIHAIHDGKIRTRGRCRSFFGHDTLRDLARYTWDRACVVWQVNEFAIPDDRVGREIHIFSDVVVCREDLEEWINGAVPDSQHGPQEAAETPVPETPKNKDDDDSAPPRRKPAELMHKRWIARAKVLRKDNKNMRVSEIASKIRREDAKSEDPNTKGEIRDKGTQPDPDFTLEQRANVAKAAGVVVSRDVDSRGTFTPGCATHPSDGPRVPPRRRWGLYARCHRSNPGAGVTANT